METKKSNQFGKRIKSIRALSGMTQIEFAREVGISPASLSNYERGERIPTVDLWEKIMSMGEACDHSTIQR